MKLTQLNWLCRKRIWFCFSEPMGTVFVLSEISCSIRLTNHVINTSHCPSQPQIQIITNISMVLARLISCRAEKQHKWWTKFFIKLLVPINGFSPSTNQDKFCTVVQRSHPDLLKIHFTQIKAETISSQSCMSYVNSKYKCILPRSSFVVSKAFAFCGLPQPIRVATTSKTPEKVRWQLRGPAPEELKSTLRAIGHFTDV